MGAPNCDSILQRTWRATAVVSPTPKKHIRCMIFPGLMPIEIQVLQDRDVVLTELFHEEWLVIDWARVYAERLKAQGWHDSPQSDLS